MNFNNDKHFGAIRNNIVVNDVEVEKNLTEEDILNSNNIELLVKYAKENRNKDAVDKVRELLELARKTGEEVVQNFFNSFKECERDGKDYLDFENTESGKLALSLLEKMPEPFKSRANEKLANYKQELKYNTELSKKHHNNPKTIWKEVTGFDYRTDSDFMERFKAFLFRDMQALSKDYWGDNKLKVDINPFAVEFVIRDADSYNKLYSDKDNKASKDTGGFLQSGYKTAVTAINDVIGGNHSETSKHETEHAIHKKTNIIVADHSHMSRLGTRLYKNDRFDTNKKMVNGAIKESFYSYLERAKDETFAFSKGGENRKIVKSFLLDKGGSSHYDYSLDSRNTNHEIINNNEALSNNEKQTLKDALEFLQSEYDRVLKNMVDLVYEKNQSVEFFRNVPINELWKYSNGKYSRTDFIIKEFKF